MIRCSIHSDVRSEETTSLAQNQWKGLLQDLSDLEDTTDSRLQQTEHRLEHTELTHNTLKREKEFEADAFKHEIQNIVGESDILNPAYIDLLIKPHATKFCKFYWQRSVTKIRIKIVVTLKEIFNPIGILLIDLDEEVLDWEDFDHFAHIIELNIRLKEYAYWSILI